MSISPASNDEEEKKFYGNSWSSQAQPLPGSTLDGLFLKGLPPGGQGSVQSTVGHRVPAWPYMGQI